MLILGHTGITLGAGTLLAGALGNSRFQKASWNSKMSWFLSLGSWIDIRLLLLGSMLPDIIDKPVGQVFFRETFSQGRIFCHTLLFLIVITIAGLYLRLGYNKGWLLVFSFGTFTHLILDQMWLAPRTLFWPLYGFAFERAELADWVPNILYALMTNPEVYIPELMGAVLLLWFGITLVREKKVWAFIKYGQVR